MKQSIYRNACKWGLQVAYAARQEVETIIRMLISLALLPPERIQLALTVRYKCIVALIAAD